MTRNRRPEPRNLDAAAAPPSHFKSEKLIVLGRPDGARHRKVYRRKKKDGAAPVKLPSES